MQKGRELERRINSVNILYRKSNNAIIKKEEVPIILTKKGLVATLSTVDYTGCLKGGRFIAFDVKECSSKTSFPLANIHQHQLEYLRICEKLGGLCFFLIQFKNIDTDRAFRTPIQTISDYWIKAETDGAKSIKLKDFKEEWLVPINNYLEGLI